MLNSLNFEVHYAYRDGVSTRVLAAFHFRFEAEKYIEVFSSVRQRQIFYR